MSDETLSKVVEALPPGHGARVDYLDHLNVVEAARIAVYALANKEAPHVLLGSQEQLVKAVFDLDGLDSLKNIKREHGGEAA